MVFLTDRQKRMMKRWLISAMISLCSGMARSQEAPELDVLQLSIQTNASPARILVEPFLSTRWSQWSPYNRFCPTVTNGLAGYEGRAPTGCVPVAMAMVLRYYSWPSAGTGTDTLHDATGGSQGDYIATWTNSIPWEMMKDAYSTYCSESPDLVDPMAELMFKLAISGETNFEAERSGAFASTLVRKAGQRLNYAVGELMSVQDSRFGPTITNEIHQRRPVMVNINFEGGHTAVADGLAEDGSTKYLHLNFGWGGRNDGWYAGFDVLTNKFFDTILSTVQPASGKSLVSCRPNFFELVATNHTLPQQTLWVMSGGSTNQTDYTLASSVSWMSVTPNTGTASVGKTAHQIAFDLKEIPPGIHNAFVEIRGDAANLPRKVSVRIYVPDLPLLMEQPEDIVTIYPEHEILLLTAEAGKTYTPCPLYNPLGYQWFYNNQPIPNQTNFWCQTIGFGAYQCEVSNLGGRAKSREVKVVLPPKGIQASEVKWVDGELQFLVENIQSQKIIIEMSTDLKSWKDMYSFTANPEQTRVMLLSLPLPSQSKAGFFRLREQ